MAQRTPADITRENELVIKSAVALVSPSAPVVTPAERDELAELLEKTV
jgi:hypothetical protein